MTEAFHPKQILYTIGIYDSDGDLVEGGVFLHFGSTIVKAAETVEEFKTITGHMEVMVKEIEENYEAAQ